MDNDNDLAYDLRQKYAEIVGVHLEAVTIARMGQDYPRYFRALENLYTVVKHKFKEKKKNDSDDKKKKTKKSDIEKYEELRTTAIEIANKHSTVYLGQTENPDEVFKIETAFRNMEMFLFKVMDGSKMFGASWDGGGL